MSVRALARAVERNYKNVHTDVRRLEQIGLIGRTKDNNFPKATIDIELGEILMVLMPEREPDDELTFFKTVGVAMGYAATAAAILTEAE